MTIGKHIKKLRKALDLTQQELADKLKLSRSNIATYEVGKNNPADAVVNLICREFNVNETWLRTGEGEMFVKIDADDELKQIFEAISVSEDETLKRVIRAYWRLSDGGKAGFREMLDNLVEEYNAGGEPLPTADKDIRAVPTRTKADTAVQPNPDIAADLVAKVAELERQNQELAAKVSAMEEEEEENYWKETAAELNALFSGSAGSSEEKRTKK